MKREVKFTFLTHLDDLRRRLFFFVLFLFLLWGALFSFFPRLVPLLIWPYQKAFPDRELELVFTTLPEAIVAALKSTFFLALALSLPFLIFQLWRFLSPALYPEEKRLFLRLLFLMVVLAAGGLTLAYLLVLPALLHLLLGIGYTRFTPYLRLQSYLSFLGKSIFFAALVSQVPLLTAFLHKAGLLPGRRKRLWWSLAGASYLLGLFISPSDLVSQFLLALVFFSLLASGLWLSRLL